MDTQFIQSLDNPNFILYRESNIFRLGTIAKGGVVDLDGIGAVQKNATSLRTLDAYVSVFWNNGVVECWNDGSKLLLTTYRQSKP
jgi:hypothetical protein